jgi:CheY-like chemotaxis protein
VEVFVGTTLCAGAVLAEKSHSVSRRPILSLRPIVLPLGTAFLRPANLIGQSRTLRPYRFRDQYYAQLAVGSDWISSESRIVYIFRSGTSPLVEEGELGPDSRWRKGGLACLMQPECKPPERWIHILVVDDEEDIRDQLRSYLEASGYYVLVADSGSTGLKLAEHFPGAIDVLITDIRMPHMGGIEFARQMRAVRPKMKILYMSAAAGELSSAALEPDINCISKPFLRESLSKKLLHILGRSQSRSTQTR